MIPANSNVFGEVRSLLQSAPHVGVWSRLCQLVESTSQGGVCDLRILSYVLDSLARWPDRWPDELRRAPMSWSRMLRQGRAGELPWEMICALRVKSPLRSDSMLGQELELEGNETVHELLRHGVLGQLRELELIELGVDDDGFSALLGAREAAGLRRLAIHHSLISARGVREIARAKHLEHLEVLDLRENASMGGYEEAIAQLVQARHLASLRSLDIECELTPEDLERVLGATIFTNLEHLGLSSCFHQPGVMDDEFFEIDLGALNADIALPALCSLGLANNLMIDDELLELLQAPWLGRLRALDLAWNDLGDGGICALVTTEALSRLEKLSLRGCLLTELAATELVSSAWMTRLRELDVSHAHGPVVLEGVELPALLSKNADRSFWIDALTSSSMTLDALVRLNLSDLEVGLARGDVRALRAHHVCAKLERLELANTSISEDGVLALFAAGDGFERLSELNLNRNHDLGDALASALASAGLTGLRHLKVRECGLRDDHVSALARAPGLARLEVLDLRGNDLSEDAINELLDAPNLRTCHVIA